jgi:GT2 family glycosyltransferase
MTLGFVCTNYNNAAYTREAVASLHRGGSAGVRIAVVDNQSGAADVDELRSLAREYPAVDLILNERNVGYFPGLNIGIAHLRERYPDVDVLAVGNNDLVFSPGFADLVDTHRDVFDAWAVVAPDLVTPEGVHQNPHVLHPIGRLRKLVWEVYYSSYAAARLVIGVSRLTRRFTVREENDPRSALHTRPGPIEQGYGACYLLGPLFFRHFAELCAPTFMMQEEFFVYEQLKTIGQMTYYDPRFVVQHRGHATTHRLTGRRQWAIARDAHQVYRRYVRMSPAAQAGMLAGNGHHAEGVRS